MGKPDYKSTKTEGYIRPSERMFRRSQKAQLRRRKAAIKESRFFRFVFGIASVTTLIVFAVIYVLNAQTAMAQEAAETASKPADPAIEQTALTTPILGNFTPIDLMGFAFVVIAGYAVYRKFNSK